MKKSLIFVIIILLISLVAFPVIFAEGGTSYLIDTKNVDTEVLSNMDNYMKLNSPVAIDKTDDYLAVATTEKSSYNLKITKQGRRSMEIINQTNRTLLLDVINPDKMDLLTLVGDVRGQDSLK